MPKNMPKLSDYRNLRILSINTLITVLLLTCIHGAAANQAHSPELLPFGVAVGDVRGPTCDDCTAGPVILYVPFTFIETEYRQIYVNSNGVLSFERSFTLCCGSRSFPRSSPPLIAPFWHDFNPRVGGNIYYRQTNDSQLLQLYHIRLSRALATKGLDNFFPALLFIATWDQVAQYGGSAQVNNTLQVVLATDRVHTLAVFIYKDINWGQRAQIGFNVGDGYTAFVFPEALSVQTLYMDESSNVGKLGVYVHRIDKPPLLKLSGIMPFGVNTSDVPGPPGDDSSSKPLTLRVPFPFFGREYNTIIVNSNGILSFDTPFTSCCPPRDFPMASPPLIAPFWLDFDLTGTNESGIYYRQTNDSIYLEFIHTLLMNVSVGGLVDFLPTQLFIATWDKVPQYQSSGSTMVHNTFQVLLSTDGNQTVSIFIYHQVRWGLGAQIGFNAGDGYTSFTFPEALSNQTLSIDQHSNIGEPGVFVYRIDVPPDQPHALTVENSEATSISISWEPPTLSNLDILYYILNVKNVNGTTGGIKEVNTTNNATCSNVTGLLPGTSYELTVAAAFNDGNKCTTTCGSAIFMSQLSSSVTATTGSTVPALSCGVPVSSNGVITVTWSYIHTGGLPLTNVFLTYTHLFLGSNFTNNNINDISVSSVGTTSVIVSDLITGAEYTFNITAENNIGSSSIICGPTSHVIGLPAAPVFGYLQSGPMGGQITFSIQSPTSGIDGNFSDSEVFWFVITPIHDGIEGESVYHLSINYQSSTFETIVVEGLEEGENYVFNATAVNMYGSSLPTISTSVLAGVVPTCTLTPTDVETGRLPAAPVFGHLQSGPKGGQITLSIQSPTSGIDRQFSDPKVFWFVIIPISDGIEAESVSHFSMNYQSGSFETIIVEGLEEGESYVFNATAVNMYGSSLPTTSMSVLAGVAPTLTPNSNEKGNINSLDQNTSISTISIIGAVTGIGALVLLFILLFLILFLIHLQVRRGKAEISRTQSIQMNRVVNASKESKTKNEDLYEEPGELLRQVQQVPL